MPDAAASWRQGLPRDCFDLVVPPRRFRTHRDEEASAQKLNGFDADGQRCFVRHDHTLVIEGFDIDEMPITVAVRHERRTAWRLHSGQWLLTVDHVARLDSCKPQVDNHLFIAEVESQLGM